MATTARTRTDVDNMSVRDRVWDTLTHSYGEKKKDSNQAFDKAYSQASRELMNRGMSRSSFGLQTLANVNKQRADAIAKIDDDLIAEYENRLGQIEQQEADNAFREKQFAESVRQFNAGQELTRTENALNRAFQTSERLGQQVFQAGESALERAFRTGEREAQQKYNTSEREAQQKFATGEREAQQAYNTAERLAQQIYQANQDALARQFQAEQNALNRDQAAEQFAAEMAYKVDRGVAQDAQWLQAFNYQAGRDERSDYQWDEQTRIQQEQFAAQQDFERQQQTRQLALSYAQALLSAGMEVPNSLLQQAGLDIRNGQVVLAENVGSGGGGGYSGSGGGSGNGGGNGSGTGGGSDSDSAFNFDINKTGYTMGAGGNIAQQIAAGAAQAAQERLRQYGSFNLTNQ